MPNNPIRDVERIARPRKQVRALTNDEAAKLRAALRADEAAVVLDLRDLVDFMLGTGLRIGEACAVRWSAVDLAPRSTRPSSEVRNTAWSFKVVPRVRPGGA